MAREARGGTRCRKSVSSSRGRVRGNLAFNRFDQTTIVTYRMMIAFSSLVSGLVALYLHLWKLGITGSLACTNNHGCELVQGSRFGWFLGVDVALIGTIGYAMLFVTAIVSTMPRFEDEKWPNTLMQIMIWPAVLFTVRLKYGEFFVVKSFCPWCAISAVVITLCAVLVVLDRRRLNQLEAE